MIRQRQQNRGQILTPTLHRCLAATLLLFLFTAFQSTTLYAQQWEKFITVPDSSTHYANSILETPDGGIVVASHIGDGSGTDQVYMTKLDSLGNLIWENTFGTDSYDEIRSMALTPDGGFILGGFTYEMTGAGNGQCYLVKVSSEGQFEWEREYGGATGPLPDEDKFDRIHGVTTAVDGYVFGGWINSAMGNDVDQEAQGGDDIWIAKVDATGDNVLWNVRIGDEFINQCYDITNSADGGFVAVGTSYDNDPETSQGIDTSYVHVIKLNADGSIAWENEFGQDDVRNEGFSIEPTDDDGFIISGVTFNPVNGDSDMYLLKIDANGDQLWQKAIGGPLGEWGSYAVQTPTGYAISGSTRSYGSDSLDIILVFTDMNGDSLDQKVYEGGSNLDNVNHMSKYSDGGFLIAAQDRNSEDINHVTSNMYLLKTNSEGQTLTTTVEGSVFWDANGNCDEGTTEAGLNDWLVVLESNDRTFYATTDINGDYSALIDTGNYTISLIAPNQYWTSSCSGLEQNLNVTSYYDSLTVDFSTEAETNCYYLEADVSTPFLQACEDATYTVRFCNTGTVSSFGTFAEIELDDDFVLNSVSQPYILNGNQLIVGIGTVAPGACDSFQINVNLDCATALTGQTHGLELNMVPNNLCTPNPPGWDLSSLEVDGECEGDSVRFTVTNTGSPMVGLQQFIIIIDDLVSQFGTIDLPTDEVLTVMHLAEGATLRLEAQQSDNHPGRSAPSVTVEGCSTNMGGGISLGYVNQFAEDDANAHRSDDNQESLESGLPPMLRAFPKGHHIENYLKPNQDIEYLIRYQNTTGDTIQEIIVENIIPDEWDTKTIQPGSASHDYDFEIVGEGKGILRFKFNNLALMDSLENEGQSHLFVKFRVSQKEDLPEETEITNQVVLNIDGTKLSSNLVFHTVEKAVVYQPYIVEQCIGTIYNDLFILQSDTVLLDTISFGTYDLWEIAVVEALPNAHITVDTVLMPGTPYEGVVYEEDTTYTHTYPAFNSCDSMVTTNIMITSTGVEDNETLIGYSLYPNPVDDDLHLHYTLANATEVGYEIKEILTGKVIYKAAASRESAGEHYRKINMKSIPVGTYLLCIQAENDLLIQKLIKL